jgi:hypothetical protein
MRDGLCRPEDVQAKLARDFAQAQAAMNSQAAGGVQEQGVSPPGMIPRKIIFYLTSKSILYRIQNLD